MNNNAERDTKKTIDRLSIATSSVSSKTFDLVDQGAKKLSDIKEERDLKTSENETNQQQEANNKEVNSRLKTSKNTQEKENVQEENKTEEFISRIKTNVNNLNDNKSSEEIQKDEAIGNDEDKPKVSKLKTSASKVLQKTFKFNDNQGKISKTITVMSKTGSKLSKTGRAITRTSRELNKAISNDGTGTEYINDKIGRKVKTKAYKITKKGANKIKKNLIKQSVKN